MDKNKEELDTSRKEISQNTISSVAPNPRKRPEVATCPACPRCVPHNPAECDFEKKKTAQEQGSQNVIDAAREYVQREEVSKYITPSVNQGDEKSKPTVPQPVSKKVDRHLQLDVGPHTLKTDQRPPSNTKVFPEQNKSWLNPCPKI